MAIRRKRQLVDRRGGNRTEKFRELQKLLPGGGGAPIALKAVNGANRRPTVPDPTGGADESDKAVAASARSVETEALKSVS
jgi:hypothetical protein